MISNPDKVYVSAPTASNAADERQILAIAQDLINATTHGRVKTPNHIGFGDVISPYDRFKAPGNDVKQIRLLPSL